MSIYNFCDSQVKDIASEFAHYYAYMRNENVSVSFDDWWKDNKATHLISHNEGKSCDGGFIIIRFNGFEKVIKCTNTKIIRLSEHQLLPREKAFSPCPQAKNESCRVFDFMNTGERKQGMCVFMCHDLL